MSKSDRERASRLRRREREGEDLSDRDARWLARYEAERRPAPRASPRPRERERVEPVEATPVVEAEPVDLVEIAGPATPPATPQGAPATPQGAPATPGATQGNAPSNAVPGANVGGPLPTLHKPTCPVGADCPGCAGYQSAAPICVTTGNAIPPPLTDVAARGFAGIVLGVIGLGVRLYARLVLGRVLEAVDPTDLERSELADALRAMFRQRPSFGWLGSTFGDLAAVFGAVGSYGRRSLRAPRLTEGE